MWGRLWVLETRGTTGTPYVRLSVALVKEVTTRAGCSLLSTLLAAVNNVTTGQAKPESDSQQEWEQESQEVGSSPAGTQAQHRKLSRNASAAAQWLTCRLQDEAAPFSVRDANTSLRTGLHTVTNKCCFTQLSPRLIKTRPRQKLLSAVRFCESSASALLRFPPRNGCILGWKVLETCGRKLPQRSFSQSRITSPNQSHPPLEITYQSVKEHSLLQIQHAWRPDLVTRLRKSHTQQDCNTRHETSCLLLGCGSHLFACVLFCFSTHFIQPSQQTHSPLSGMVFTASVCRTQ